MIAATLGESLDGEWNGAAMQGPALVFEDEHHLSSVTNKLNTLRKEGQLCDVAIQVGRNNFPAHRAVLACTSGYLMELFTEDEGNSRTHFKLPNIDMDAFEILVDYAYTSRLEVPEELVITVYKTATLLKIPSAAEACCKFLAENLTLQNCLAIRRFANSTCDAELTEAIDTFLQENLRELIENPSFATLPGMQFDIMGVGTEELEESGEANVAQLVVTWLEAALNEQKFNTFTENPHVLYLTEDNELRDCLSIQADTSGYHSDAERDLVDKLHHSEVVQDYVKLSKRKQIPAVKGSKVNQRSQQGQTTNLTKGRKQNSIEKLTAIPEEWKLIATYMVKACTCISVAMLEDRLTVIQLKFRPIPQDGGDMAEQSACRSGAHSPVNSPYVSVMLDKQVSLNPLATMSQGRCSAGSAAVEGCILAVGGYDRGECLDSMECYNPCTNTWSPLAPMTTARGRFDIAQIDKRLYACGGSNGSSDLKSAEVYDWDAGQWSKLPDMKYQRSSPGVAALNDKVYVIGGWSGYAGLRQCEVYDPATNLWTDIADMNFGRSQAAVCTFKGKIVVVGGCDAWNCTNAVTMYDPQTDEWTNLPPMISHRRGSGVTAFDGRLYVVGGSDGQSSLSCVEIFDFDSMTWTSGPVMGITRANVATAVAGDRLYAVGGFSGKHFLNSIECLVKDKKEWCGFAQRMATSGSESSAESDAPISDIESNFGSEAGDRENGVKLPENDAKLPENGTKLQENGAKLQENGAKYDMKCLENGDEKPILNGGHSDSYSNSAKDLDCQTTTTKECVSNKEINGHALSSMCNGINGYS